LNAQIRAAIGVALALAAGVALAQGAPAFKTEKESLSYALGLGNGIAFRKHAVEIDPDLFRRGFEDAYSGGKTLMTEQEARALLAARQSELRQKREQQAAQLKEELGARAEKNRSESEAFLSENKTKDGVVALQSGLQYKVLKAGDGPIPTVKDMVVVHYRGTLLDGTEFDNSRKNGQPSTLPVNKVIPGWREALQLMPVGSSWQLFIPPALAYGERGAGNAIGPQAALVFEVELLGVKERPALEAPGKKKTKRGKPRSSAKAPASLAR
jgi:FKBP-type peptidyl-prolyl cis-trans isomerase FklB